MLYELMVPREVTSPSQIIHINMITETNEIRLPKDEMMFHVVKASG